MGMTKQDYAFYDGWKYGYKTAIEDIRDELLTLQQDRQIPVPIEVFEILNKQAESLKGFAEHGKAVNLPKCETEEDLVFNNID